MDVVPVVEAPLHFFKVTVQVLDAHLMESPGHRPLEQRPHGFDAVGVNLSDNPLFFGVIDRPMTGVGVLDSNVGFQLVGVNRFGLILHRTLDKVMQGVASDVRDSLKPNLTSTLDGSGNPGLVSLIGVTLALRRATYKRFVYFNNSEQCWAVKRVVAHRFADSMAEIPRRLVGHIKRTLQLVSRYPFARLAHQVDRQEPLTQRKVGVVHYRPGSHRKLVTAILATPFMHLGILRYSHPTAACASNAIGPAQLFKGDCACSI